MIETDDKEQKLTQTQLNSIHLYCENLARDLNDAGLDQRKVLKPGIEIPWTKDSVKLQLFKAIEYAMFGKDSTTKLTTKQVDEVYQVLSRHLAEKFNITTPFPNRFNE